LRSDHHDRQNPRDLDAVEQTVHEPVGQTLVDNFQAWETTDEQQTF
jgi:hypothetical protein